MSLKSYSLQLKNLITRSTEANPDTSNPDTSNPDTSNPDTSTDTSNPRTFCELVKKKYDECKNIDTDECRDVVQIALMTGCIAPKPRSIFGFSS
jgi:hypothetical protein